MPTVPGSRCVEPGCGQFAPFGQARCVDHAADLERDLHAGSHRRVYLTDRWRGVARSVRDRDPTCRCVYVCHPRGGCGSPTTDVDHVEPLRDVVARGGDPYDMTNLVGLCSPCHSRKTADESGILGLNL